MRVGDRRGDKNSTESPWYGDCRFGTLLKRILHKLILIYRSVMISHIFVKHLWCSKHYPLIYMHLINIVFHKEDPMLIKGNWSWETSSHLPKITPCEDWHRIWTITSMLFFKFSFHEVETEPDKPGKICSPELIGWGSALEHGGSARRLPLGSLAQCSLRQHLPRFSLQITT